MPVTVGKKKHKLFWPSMTYNSTKFGKNRPVVSKVGKVATTKDCKERKYSDDI
jgi:hypothetical protein